MDSPITVRPARIEDVDAMARVLVQSWRETYRGLISDRVLDDPGFVAARERFWSTALVDERYRANRIAVAERDGVVVGVAMAGPPEAHEPGWSLHLYVLYVLAPEHGSGAGAALLDAVISPHESAALWVADPNPRAQAFYRKHGFVADGTIQVDDGVREIRMVRTTRDRPGASDDA
ncbi:MAG TPA: GNAT family N-acetyltransferase [Agromyces sp.]